MAERDADAGQQFAHAERLGQVVVGAGVERGDLVFLLPASREHDHRRRQPFAQGSQHVQAVLVRQAQIEDDEIGRL